MLTNMTIWNFTFVIIFLYNVDRHMPQNHIDYEYVSYLSALLGVVYCVWYAMSDTSHCKFVMCSSVRNDQ